MYCHVRKCEIKETGKTSCGWAVGRKEGARGRAGLIVHGELLEDIKICSKERSLTQKIADRYGVSSTTITNLAVTLGLIKRKSYKNMAEKRKVLKSLYQNLDVLFMLTKGRENKRGIHLQAGKMRSTIYAAMEYNKPLSRQAIAEMRTICTKTSDSI